MRPCPAALRIRQRKEPKERAALPLRRPRSTSCGTGGAKTRCAQTVCPFFPVPHPAARLSAKGLFSSPETRIAPNHPPGGASVLRRGGGILRAIVEGDRSHAPAWERGRDAPASSRQRRKGLRAVEVSRPTGENLKRPTVLKETGRRSVRGGVPTLERGNDQKKNNRGHGPLLQPPAMFAGVGAGHARDCCCRRCRPQALFRGRSHACSSSM